jgi:hypothetical protein
MIAGLGSIIIGLPLIYFSIKSLLYREEILKKAKIDRVVLEEAYVKGLLILELAGIILVTLGILLSGISGFIT